MHLQLKKENNPQHLDLAMMMNLITKSGRASSLIKNMSREEVAAFNESGNKLNKPQVIADYHHFSASKDQISPFTVNPTKKNL